jgi:hypothetical protein
MKLPHGARAAHRRALACILVLPLVLSAGAAEACRPARPTPSNVAQRVERSEFVFLGAVAAIREDGREGGRVRFTIERTYKGAPSPHADYRFRYDHGMCDGRDAKVGYRAIFFVFRLNGELWVAPQIWLEANESMMREAMQLIGTRR